MADTPVDSLIRKLRFLGDNACDEQSPGPRMVEDIVQQFHTRIEVFQRLVERFPAVVQPANSLQLQQLFKTALVDLKAITQTSLTGRLPDDEHHRFLKAQFARSPSRFDQLSTGYAAILSEAGQRIRSLADQIEELA